MLFTCKESFIVARTNYGILSKVRDGLVAVNEMTGTLLMFAISDMKNASEDF